MIKTSIVIPIYNEAPNLVPLYRQLVTLDEMAGVTSYQSLAPFEIIVVDDGSTDDPLAVLQPLLDADPRLTVIQLRRNYGKTAALAAGFWAARGAVIVTMDGDLQDHPLDMDTLVNALLSQPDCGVVSGWRVNRADNDPLSKTLPSQLYNRVVRWLTGVPLHDFNCGYKAYRREALQHLRLYGELHRFIPVLIADQGYQVAEVVVNHRPRYQGRSKFGPGRLIAGFLDFGMVLFLTRYLKQPLRLFGLLGSLSLGAGTLISGYLAMLWLLRTFADAQVAPIGTRPLFIVGILAIIFGVQLISIGLLGEMVRYFSFRDDQEYSVKSVRRAEPKEYITIKKEAA